MESLGGGHSINDVLIFMLAFLSICGIVSWVSDRWGEFVSKRQAREGAFDCCEHCGCRPGDQNGHDFACSQGCDREFA